MIGIGTANVAAGFFQGFAVSTSGSRTAVAEQSGRQEPAHRPRRRRRGRAAAAVLQLAARRPAADGARRGRDRGGALAGRHRRRCAATRRVRNARRSCCRSWPPSASSSSACCRASCIAVVLSILLFFQRSWWPHGEVLGRVERRRGGTASSATPGRPSSARRRSSTAGRRRCSSPTPACSASRSATSSASGSPRWVVLQCEAITDIDVTAADMLEQLDTELNAAGRPPRLRRAARPAAATSSTATGCFETLDRDHFYPSIEAGARRRSPPASTPTTTMTDRVRPAGRSAPGDPPAAPAPRCPARPVLERSLAAGTSRAQCRGMPHAELSHGSDREPQRRVHDLGLTVEPHLDRGIGRDLERRCRPRREPAEALRMAGREGGQECRASPRLASTNATTPSWWVSIRGRLPRPPNVVP